MKIFKISLSLLIIVSSIQGFGQSKKTSVKNQKTLLNMRNAIWSESLKGILRLYHFAGTPERFDRLALQHLSPTDRKYFLKSLGKTTKLPLLTLSELTFKVASKNGSDLKLQLVDLAEKQFRVNGVLWTYRPKETIESQVKMLQKMVSQNHSSSSSFASDFEVLQSIVLPEAQAVAFVPLIAGAIIGSVITSGLMDPIIRASSKFACDLTNERLEWDTTRFDLCVEWKKKKIEAGRLNRSNLNAITNLVASDKSNVLGKFKVVSELSCADNSDGKERLYSSKVSLKKTEQKFNLDARFSPEGSPLELKIQDSNNPSTYNIITFDSEGFFKCVILPNSAAGADPLTAQETELCPENATSEESKAKVSFLEDVVRFVNLRVTRCNVQQAAESIARGQEVPSPLDPPSEAPPAEAPESANQ